MKQRNLSFKTFIILLIICILPQNITSQKWNNKKAAVALTYDDGLNVHLDIVVPTLDLAGFKGTFYIPGNAEALFLRMNDWKTIACNGHELGNHTLFHPCTGKSKGRQWVHPDYDLDNYTINQIVNEIKLANTLLKAIDGKEKRSFAYTCGDMTVSNGDFSKLIANEFTGARGVNFNFEKIETIDLLNIKAFFVTNQTGEELITLAQKAVEEEALIVFLFHGVGGEHSINIANAEHQKLVNYLKTNIDSFWVAPLTEISEYIQLKQ